MLTGKSKLKNNKPKDWPASHRGDFEMNTVQNQDSESLSLRKGHPAHPIDTLIQNSISISPTSTVYQARDLHFPGVQKMVLVKEFRNPSPDPEQRLANVESFERKANLLATLSHPAIPGNPRLFHPRKTLFSGIGIYSWQDSGLHY